MQNMTYIKYTTGNAQEWVCPFKLKKIIRLDDRCIISNFVLEEFDSKLSAAHNQDMAHLEEFIYRILEHGSKDDDIF